LIALTEKWFACNVLPVMQGSDVKCKSHFLSCLQIDERIVYGQSCAVAPKDISESRLRQEDLASPANATETL